MSTKCNIDPNDPTTYVVCQITGRKMARISPTYLKQFGMTCKEYKEKFGVKYVASEQLRKAGVVTLESLQGKWGIEEGLIRWERYRTFQAKKNTFEYKRDKYGWTQEQFDEYNNKRACTLKNFIERHGDVDGLHRWEKYCKRQAYAGSSEQWFINKYGAEQGVKEWNRVCKAKMHTLETYIARCGGDVELGKALFESYIENHNSGISVVATSLFTSIAEARPGEYRFGEEEWVCWDKQENHPWVVDFIDRDTRKIIEFFGDYWHCAPHRYAPDWVHPVTHKTAKETWAFDDFRIRRIKDITGNDVLIIWESDYRCYPSDTVAVCVDFLNK